MYNGITYPGSPFIFDAIYENYSQMQQYISNIFLGRYVLVMYCNEIISQDRKQYIEANPLDETLTDNEKIYLNNYNTDKNNNYKNSDRIVYNIIYKDGSIQAQEVSNLNITISISDKMDRFGIVETRTSSEYPEGYRVVISEQLPLRIAKQGGAAITLDDDKVLIKEALKLQNNKIFGVANISSNETDGTLATNKKYVDDSIAAALNTITSFGIDDNSGNGYASIDDLPIVGEFGIFYLVNSTQEIGDYRKYDEYYWTGTKYDLVGSFGGIDYITRNELEEAIEPSVSQEVSRQLALPEIQETFKGDKGDTGDSWLVSKETISYSSSIILEPNKMIDIDVLAGPIVIALATGITNKDNEWDFIITQGDTAYYVDIPSVNWTLGIAPIFAANTTTQCRLYYIKTILCGEWMSV